MDESIKLSVSEILKLDAFEGSKVLTGETRLDQWVNRVNIIVDPDIDKFIHPGELLLSTSFFFKAMPTDRQIEFIQMLSNRGIACLGIKFSPHLESLDEAVLNHARKLSFVIFSIEFNTSFTTLISRIYETLFERQVEVLRKISQVHDRAMALLSEGGDIFDIIRTLEEALGSRVLILDSYYDQVFAHPDHAQSEELVESVEAFRVNHRQRMMRKGQLTTVALGKTVYHRYVYPLNVKNEVYGYLVAFFDSDRFIEMKRQLVESVSTVASLYFYNRLTLEEVELSYRSEFFENLLSGDSRRVEKALDRAHFFNMPPEGRYQVVRFLAQDEAMEGQNLIRLLHRIRSMLASQDINAILSVIHNQVNLLMQVPAGRGNTVHDRLVRMSELWETSKIITGRTVEHLRDVRRSFADCDRIMAYPGILLDNRLLAFEDLGVERLLIHASMRDEITAFHDLHLMELVEYDARRGTNMLETLRAYFQCNGNLRKMSEVLYTHYNTILYRIERIESIAGKKLDNEQDRFNLHTSLKIHDLLVPKTEEE